MMRRYFVPCAVSISLCLSASPASCFTASGRGTISILARPDIRRNGVGPPRTRVPRGGGISGSRPAVVASGSSRRAPTPLARTGALPPSTALGAAAPLLPPLPPRAALASLVVGGAAVLAIAAYRLLAGRILWPGSEPDPSLPEPLPVGSLGCPFVGSDHRASSYDFGPGAFFWDRSASLGHPRIWKFFARGVGPVAVVSGYDNVKSVLGMEFDGIESNAVPFTGRIVGTHSIRFCRDGAEHALLRRLVGASVDRAGVVGAVPALLGVARDLVGEMAASFNSGGTVDMEVVCKRYTLDIAWAQIIGLDLEEDEVPAFHRAVDDWFLGLYSADAGSGERSRDARAYLVSKIESKMDGLEREGRSDGSTIGGMLFATDDGETGSGRRLTREQVVDNTLLLILGGTETSAGTMTVASLLLGLHPRSWDEVVREQRELRYRRGEDITKRHLDEECPYLDSVVREALRMRPIVGGSMRGATRTIAVGGRQIPRGWGVVYDRFLTHALDPMTRAPDGDGGRGGLSNMDVELGFAPERWLDESTRPSKEFIPFGVGPRYCIGADLAMTEMKMFFAVMARQVEAFDLVSPKAGSIKWRKTGLIPVPEGGVIVAPRKSEPNISSVTWEGSHP